MKFRRLLSLQDLLRQKSHFLFGPRGTGKSTLIAETLPQTDYPVINLLHSETRLRLLQNPSDIRRMIPEATVKAIVIDEVQKVPDILNEVHDLIETKKLKFLLTGSSARKLKREGTNLLAGRARVAHFFPLTSAEMGEFDPDLFLHLGGLPAIQTSDAPWEDLRAYVDTYLKEEIEQEAQVRRLGNFSRFLVSAALNNAELLNFANVASDAQVAESTVRGYYQILSDTLIGSLLEPYRGSRKRKAIQTAKFYFFDTGVTHAILNLKSLSRASSNYGTALEQWVFMELRAYLSLRRIDEPLCFWRTVNGQEVDFVLGDAVGIEVKATKRVTKRDLSGLRALRDEGSFKKLYLVSQEPYEHTLDGMQCIPLHVFFAKLWADDLF
jgi:uncharacterized protein